MTSTTDWLFKDRVCKELFFNKKGLTLCIPLSKQISFGEVLGVDSLGASAFGVTLLTSVTCQFAA